ncbi:MFS transporter [Lacimicrobium alkaliphilum]|uniref:MFS transporter n=1 Tax=Lacimicrobium alkaliphilum TaxID=1526571 RepID=A0A0U2QJ48_9ALTE|nr:MFS transporter [Lacimicrobium alkaliphilum]ALS97019.1 MFS transporter [Lacimicrobium alkaliphilum]
MNNTEIRGASALAIVYVMRMLGLFMVMPVLAVLAIEYPDYSPMLVGLAIGGYGLTQALLQIPMGVLSDRLGRKPVIIAGLILFALGSLIAAMADTLLWVVVGRLLQGGGAIAGAVMALAGDISRENQRAKVMAIIGVAIGFSFYLALLLGPLLAEKHGLQGIFLITAMLALACIPLVLFVVPSARNLAPSGDTLPKLTDLGALLSQGPLLKLSLSVFLLHLMITLLFVQFPARLVDQGWLLSDHWQLYLPVLTASVLGLIVLMRLSKRLGQQQILCSSILLLATSFAGLMLDTGLPALLLLSWLFFTGFNYLEANLPAMVSTVAPAGRKGSAMGAYASAQFLGAFTGGMLSGAISQYLHANWLYALAILLCIIWIVLIRGLAAGAPHAKRYTLALDADGIPAEHCVEQLRQLAGVTDMTWVEQEKAVYLKVDSRVFNLQQARQIISPSN